MADTLVWARQQGFTYAGIEVERGLVFRLQHQPRDQQLVGLGYFEALEDNYEAVRCTACGRDFLNEMFRDQHVRRVRHPAVNLDTGPLKEASRSLSTPDPDGGGDWDIEKEGAPAPTKMEDEGSGHPASTRRGTGGAQRAREVIRLG